MPIRPARRRLLALALWPFAARAAEGGLPSNVGHGDSSKQWEHLRSQLFGTRPIASGADSVMQLVVPLRAAYGASVPVKIVTRVPQTPERYLKRLTLLVDKNPSPIAATLDLTPALGQADFETRLRVDEYSHLRVIGELDNGALHMDSRYVKVSGGCSAPPNRSALDQIGKTRFRLPDGLHPGAYVFSPPVLTFPPGARPSAWLRQGEGCQSIQSSGTRRAEQPAGAGSQPEGTSDGARPLVKCACIACRRYASVSRPWRLQLSTTV